MKILDQLGIISTIAKRFLTFFYVWQMWHRQVDCMRVRSSLLCLKWIQFLTSRNFSVTTKNILVFLYNCYHIFLSVATSVEGIASPAMWRGSVAKQPVRIMSNGRNQELMKICEIRFIFQQYNWIFYTSCNSRNKKTRMVYSVSLRRKRIRGWSTLCKTTTPLEKLYSKHEKATL